MGNNIELKKITELEQRISELEKKNAAFEKAFKDGVRQMGACDIEEIVDVVWERLVLRINAAPKSNISG